jgi:hypothetical protein
VFVGRAASLFGFATDDLCRRDYPPVFAAYSPAETLKPTLVDAF